MPLNRQAVVMARHGVPIDRSVLADWMGRTGALIAPVVDHMAKRLMAGGTRLYVDETTAPVLDPGRGKTKTGHLWAVLRDGEPLRRHWFKPNGERLERPRAAGRGVPLSARPEGRIRR